MEKTTHLTPKEIRQIKKYCILPCLVLPTILGIFIMMFLWLLLFMINDLALDAHDNPYDFILFGIVVTFAIIGIVFFTCAVLIPRFGMNGKKWKNILHKLDVHQQEIRGSDTAAVGVGMTLSGNMMRRSSNETVSGLGAAAQVAGAAVSVAAIHQMSSDMAQNAHAVADAWGISVPSPKKYKLMLLLLPALILTISFIPSFMHAAQAKEHKQQVVLQTMEQLTEALQTDTRYISFNDPRESSERTYHLSCHETDAPTAKYMYIIVDETGIVTDINWHMDEDTSLSREENLALLKEYVLKTESELKASDAPLWSTSFEAGNSIQGQLAQAYLEPSGEKISSASAEDGNVKYKLLYSANGSNYLYYSVWEK